ncbi:siderophore-interacting protein [Streptomyces sp. NPDC088674]|uniref:siderophore-interacting protein n=1 Tax=Streptomyces sp. NPDC088674 TaxID=3365869 RepID=UPI00380DF524
MADAERPARKGGRTHSGQVLRTEQLTPHMVRVVFGGDGLAEFAADEYTDHYIKLIFPREGVTYPEPFDMGQVRADFPREQWPVTRTYTVRRWDGAARELTVDFVVHGDEGLAGPWAAAAKPGDVLYFAGPGGGYRPEAEASSHLLAGDESALPAIAAAVENMPADAKGDVLVEVADATEEQKLDVPAGVNLTWLHRGERPAGEALVAAVRTVECDPATVQVFVHGEAGFVKDLRRHLRLDRGISRDRLSISGYWRLGHNEDGWQASKRDWNARIEAEQEGTEAA